MLFAFLGEVDVGPEITQPFVIADIAAIEIAELL